MISLAQANSLRLPLTDGSVQTCVTSPPYYGLRDYQIVGQFGLEPTPEEYVAKLVAVFREVKRVLRDDGCVFLNLGDSYATHNSGGKGHSHNFRSAEVAEREGIIQTKPSPSSMGLKEKDLIGIPWMVAFALRADGWWLRSDIIWAKPNPMPESVTDRPTKSHEHMFLLAKSQHYFYDAEAIKEPYIEPMNRWGGQKLIAKGNSNWDKGTGQETYRDMDMRPDPAGRNRRDVWTIPTSPFSGKKVMTDYVGGDGKSYTALPNCPIHGHLALSQKSYSLLGDGQQVDISLCSLDNNGRRGQEFSSESKSTTSHIHMEDSGKNVHVQIQENTDECKTSIDQTGRISPAQNLAHNLSKSVSRVPTDYKTDSLNLEYSVPAKFHNKQMNKIGHVSQTKGNDTSFAQSIFGIQNNGQLPLLSVQDHDNGGNNILEDDSGDNLNNQNPDCNSDNDILQEQFSASNISNEKLYCTCEEVSIEHFATFPPALVEPCIRAGTSERGCCPKCGAAWERVTERVGGPPSTRKERISLGIDRQPGTFGAPEGTYFCWRPPSGESAKYETTGWQPTCKCGINETKPCTVLDIFSGAGTTGVVCQKLGRGYVGIDLSWDYLQMSRKRLMQTALAEWGSRGAEAAGGLAGLPMFEGE